MEEKIKKPKVKKAWSVTFKLPQLAASHTWHSAEIPDASSIGKAVDKAWNIVKKRPAVKGKRLKEATVTVELL